MPFPNPDRDVPALIAELAAMHADDVAAILASLSDRERRTVERHLDDRMAGFDAVLNASDTSIPFDGTRLSSWLSSRLQSSRPAGDPMTVQARQALIACAVKLYPAGGRTR